MASTALAQNEIGPPALFDTFKEATALGEYALSKIWQPLLLLATSRAKEAAPVLVIPGLGAHDVTTKPLRNFLAKKGYSSYGWQGGINTGDEACLKNLKARFEAIGGKHPDQKIALIGHSLGGILSRELARCYPDKISQVITLGAPFGAGAQPNSVAPLVRKFFEMVNQPQHPLLDPRMASQGLTPPRVPTTSIYTPDDGIASWGACINPDLPLTENIGIYGTHCGLVANPVTYLIVADRLAQNLDENDWQKFDRAKHCSALFPTQSHEGHMPFLSEAALAADPIPLFQ